jgi:hypothetical protein
VPQKHVAQVETALAGIKAKHGEIFARLGTFEGDAIVCKDAKLSLPLAALRAAHEGWLPKYMRGEA